MRAIQCCLVVLAAVTVLALALPEAATAGSSGCYGEPAAASCYGEAAPRASLGIRKRRARRQARREARQAASCYGAPAAASCAG